MPEKKKTSKEIVDELEYNHRTHIFESNHTVGLELEMEKFFKENPNIEVISSSLARNDLGPGIREHDYSYCCLLIYKNKQK